jgi:hypothetical protein
MKPAVCTFTTTWLNIRKMGFTIFQFNTIA